MAELPLNPFRVFEYFLGDRVDRELVRQANNNLISRSDELWVFGDHIADGVFFEIRYAQELGKQLRFFTVHNIVEEIHEIAPEELRFEPEVFERTGLLHDDLIRAILEPANPAQLSLFIEIARPVVPNPRLPISSTPETRPRQRCTR